MRSKIALALAAAALTAAVVIPAGLAGASKSSRASVGVAQSKLGRILVDGRGHTLYLFGKDRRGKSSCSGTCASYWPPLIVSGKPRAASGARASLLGRTKRADGRWQVTYNRHPLYTFALDTKKGQTKGEGLDDFGGEWDAVSPAGVKVEKTASTSGSGNPSGGYGGYGGYTP
jgi:predicted lipoprotein with Yx(FWY)xxD motif